MISAGEFRNGVTFEDNNQLFQIIEFQHVKPGKGAAFVRTKVRNVITGATIEKTFNPNEKFKKAYIERKDMQYLYKDGDLYYFMDEETYEQMPLNKEQFGDALRFVKETESVQMLSHNDRVFGVEPPNFVILEVVETEPGFKGDTAQGATKLAKLETGTSVKVPLFINIGDKIRIDTRSGEYMERA
ncbi:MAG: elongation factor P [Clostridiales bacterium]|nr:elongation factor P [Clostridiales bacterium]